MQNTLSAKEFIVNIRYPKREIYISKEDTGLFMYLIHIYFKVLIPSIYRKTLKAAAYRCQLKGVCNFQIKDLHFSFMFYPIECTFRLSAHNDDIIVSLYTAENEPRIEVLPIERDR